MARKKPPAETVYVLEQRLPYPGQGWTQAGRVHDFGMALDELSSPSPKPFPGTLFRALEGKSVVLAGVADSDGVVLPLPRVPTEYPARPPRCDTWFDGWDGAAPSPQWMVEVADGVSRQLQAMIACECAERLLRVRREEIEANHADYRRVRESEEAAGVAGRSVAQTRQRKYDAVEALYLTRVSALGEADDAVEVVRRWIVGDAEEREVDEALAELRVEDDDEARESWWVAAEGACDAVVGPYPSSATWRVMRALLRQLTSTVDGGFGGPNGRRRSEVRAEFVALVKRILPLGLVILSRIEADGTDAEKERARAVKLAAERRFEPGA